MEEILEKEKTQEEIAEEEQKKLEAQIKLIKQLETNESFIAWRDLIVLPNIAQMEAELASQEADQMSEVILRSKIKLVNSLKFYFKDVFKNINN